MELEETETINAPIDAVWEVMEDFEALASCSPGFQGYKQTGKTFELQVASPLSFIAGTLTIKGKIKAMHEYEGEVHLSGSSIGSSFTVDISFSLEEKGKKTVLFGTAKASFGGLLKPVPESVLKGAADDLIKSALDCIKNKCEAR